MTMRPVVLSTLFLLVVAASALGCTAVVDSKLSDKPSGACAGMADGTPCGAGMECVRGFCVMSGCGNAYVDKGVDGGVAEQCDDGNNVNGDGCNNDCRFSCQQNLDCDDGNPCNGQEACDPTLHTCGKMPGLLPPVGSPCTATTADGGTYSGICTNTGTCLAP